MTDTGQMTSPIETYVSTRLRHGGEDNPELRVIPTTRLVQPGGWQRCTCCHQRIEFMAGAARTLVALGTYEGDRLRLVELFHSACYDEAVSVA